MLFLRSWLQKYVNISNITDKQLADSITKGSSEVEEYTRVKDYFDAKVCVGRIAHVRKHENADSLVIFDVELGSLPSVQIVSAAPNVREGMLVPVALEGARLPFVTIAKRAMRGVESYGMCLGKSELMLETQHSEGLWELDDEVNTKVATGFTTRSGVLCATINDVLGCSLCDVFPEYFAEDTVFDIKILPNRVSEIGHHMGLAREIAIIMEGLHDDFALSVQLQDSMSVVSSEEVLLQQCSAAIEQLPVSEDGFELIDTVDYVSSFMLLQGSLHSEYTLPHEYQRDMFLTGRNMVGSIADLTNYFLGDFGQPTHVFDAQKVYIKPSHNTHSDVQDDVMNQAHTYSWVVDKTVTPMTFKGLGNLKDAVLPAGIPILYDAKDSNTVLALPGISGGESSGVEYKTRDFLFEIANFDGEDVAQASFDLKYRSDGSRIWTGGVNPLLMSYALLRLVQESQRSGFELQLAGLYTRKTHATVRTSQEIMRQMNAILDELPHVDIDWEYFARRLDGRGVEVWRSRLETVLNRLGRVVVRSNGDGEMLVPHGVWSNIRTQNDVLEELIRLIDYDDLAMHEIAGASVDTVDASFEAMLAIKRRIAGYGFQEVITRPFVGAEYLEHDTEDAVIRVLKPYNTLMPFVRDNLIGSLLGTLSENIQRGEKEPRIFELGLVYTREGNTVHAWRHVSLVGVSADPYVFTSVVMGVGGSLFSDFADTVEIQALENNRGKGYEYYIQGRRVAVLYEVANTYKKSAGIPLNKKVFALTIALDADMPEFSYPHYTDETSYPVVRRSYSYKIAHNITLKNMLQAIQSVDTGDINVTCTPIERFSESDDYDVINIAINYKQYERTLDGDEITHLEQQFITELQKLGTIELR